MSQTQQSPEKIWFQKKEYEEAEKQFYENLAQVKQGNSPPSALPNKQPESEVTKPNPQTPPPPAKKPEAQVENPTKGGGGKKSNKKAENKEGEKGSKGKKQVVIEEALPKVESPTSEKKDLPEKIASPPPKKPENEESKNESAPKKPAEVTTKEGPVDSMGGQGNAKASLASEVAKARQHIKSSLECIDGIAAMAVNNLNVDLTNRVNTLEIENSSLKKQVSDLTGLLNALSLRVSSLEKTPSAAPAPKAPSAQPPKKAAKPDDDDDGVDLFGSDSEEEDDEAKKVREQRLAEYNAKKSKKPVLIAKSNIILDVKPWDDETDMKAMEAKVRTIQTDGLVWGASKLVPLAFGIHKLQISCVVEDDKVSVDWLQENIEAFEDLVQSVDIAAFNKV